MKLWVATQNKHKLKEIAAILGPTVSLASCLDLSNMPDIPETGSTYKENAYIKASSLWNCVREPVFADDSGLEVAALGGRPGVRSHRYSEPNPTYEKNIDKLLDELFNVPLEKRIARFVCSICYMDVNGKNTFFDGILDGYIGFERRGHGGFGFDPIFMLPSGLSVAELSEEEKNAISHRSLALQKLKNFLQI